MNNMMSSIYRNMAGPSTATQPTSSRDPGDLVLDPEYGMTQSGGSDACITIDDSSDSDKDLAALGQKSGSAFFVDRMGDQSQISVARDSEMSYANSPQGGILDVSGFQPTIPGVGLQTAGLLSQTKKKKLEVTDGKEGEREKRKEMENASSGKKTPKMIVRRIYY